MNNSTTTPTRGGTAAPSTKTPPLVGQVVLVTIDTNLVRPMLITDVYPQGISGTLFCEPDDTSRPAFRGCPGITGIPTRLQPFARADRISPGTGIGEWCILPPR